LGCDMASVGDSSALNPLTAAYLKACEDYLGVQRAIVEQFSGDAAPAAAMALPAAFIGAWKILAQGFGVRIGDSMQQSLGGPALGLAREHLEIVQRMSDLGLQFQRSYAEFIAHLSGIQSEAMRTVQSLDAGAAYDEWIEGAEAAYASLAHGATFARLLGELCNTLSELKLQRGKLLEYFSRQLDLPTRAEIDSLHQQVRLLREQSRASNGAEQSGAERLGTEQIDTKPSDTKQSGTKQSGAKRSGAKRSGAKRSGAKRSGAKRSGK
jgi:hypothetical protein